MLPVEKLEMKERSLKCSMAKPRYMGEAILNTCDVFMYEDKQCITLRYITLLTDFVKVGYK